MQRRVECLLGPDRLRIPLLPVAHEVQGVDEVLCGLELVLVGAVPLAERAEFERVEWVLAQVVREGKRDKVEGMVAGLNIRQQGSELRGLALALDEPHDGRPVRLVERCGEACDGGASLRVAWLRREHLGPAHEVVPRNVRAAGETDELQTLWGRVLERRLVRLGEGYERLPILVPLNEQVRLQFLVGVGQAYIGALQTDRGERTVRAGGHRGHLLGGLHLLLAHLKVSPHRYAQVGSDLQRPPEGRDLPNRLGPRLLERAERLAKRLHPHRDARGDGSEHGHIGVTTRILAPREVGAVRQVPALEEVHAHHVHADTPLLQLVHHRVEIILVQLRAKVRQQQNPPLVLGGRLAHHRVQSHDQPVEHVRPLAARFEVA
mmetsp:Transcript_14585/g.41441  ORF Transcript_14585/g.41441 Transcript_14585/m.41441 type:complete len:377 (-) Transcript_14585:493-1623(-)